MNDPASQSVVPELNGRNWRQWFIRMENYLRIYGLWDVTCTDSFDNAQVKKEWTEKEQFNYERMQQARCRIVNTMNEEYSGYVNHCKTAHQAWQTLKDLYRNSSSLRESELRDRLVRTRKTSEQSVDQYINSIMITVDELRQLDIELTEEEITNVILEGLPSSYHTIVLVLKHYHEKLTVARVRQSLCYEECYQRRGRLYLSHESEEPDLATASEAITTRCQFCQKTGHILNQCHRFKAAYPPKTVSSNRKDKPMCLVAKTNQTKAKDQNHWVIDSGASWHMTGTKEVLDPNSLTSFTGSIEIADGTLLRGEMMGSATINLPNEDCKAVTLKNVVYVPGLKANLLSVPCMTNNGATVSFDNECCTIRQEDNTIKANLDQSNNYCLTASAKTWHERLGHISSERIKKLKVPYQMTEICEPCMENKQSATKFKKKDYEYKPLDLLYMDVVGPIHPETPAGQRYFLSVLDHATKTSMIYLMSSKGSTGKYVRTAINAFEQKVAGKRTVKAIRTDLGQEFLGTKLAEFLADRGITHEKTAGYTPQQNDAERLHRDIREHASAMLNATNLPNKYWGEAVRAYVHCRNRVPPSLGEDSKSPLEKLSGSKQSIKHLRVFGCEAWVLKPKEKVNGKFDKRSEKGIFIGYENSSTYRVLLSNRLVTSRNVKFNERRMGDYTRPTTHDEITPYTEDLINEPDQWEQSSEESETENNDELHTAETSSETPDTVEYPANNQPNNQRYNLRPNRQTNFRAYKSHVLTDKFDGYQQAMRRPDQELWKEAIQNELDALSKMRTWEVCELPQNRKPIGSKWIFRIKRDSYGNILKYKARLVALGCHQKPGIDYDEIYASVVSKTGLRIFLAMVNQLNLHLYQLDIETAFLNADLHDEIYLRIPEGFNTNSQNQAVKLNRSLYGLKQAPRAWNEELTTTLKKLGFTLIEVDQSILMCKTDQGVCYLCFYVDDILIASQQIKLIETIKNLIKSKYKATDLGEAKHFLGLTIKRNRIEKSMNIEQTGKVNDYLKQHGVTEAKEKETPLSVPLHNQPEDDVIEQENYQKIVGQLQYLGATTRPDIAQAASVLARFNQHPTKVHWNAIRGTLKYLNSSRELVMTYKGTDENTEDHIQITAYSDADYASNSDNRRSRTGFAIIVLGSLVSWQSKLQTTIANSTTEAEYQAACSAIKESLWIRNLIKQMLQPKTITVTILMDNQSALRLMKNPQSVTQAKHIDVQHHFIRERAMREEIELRYCSTENMWADYLTKTVPAPKFKQCLKNLGLSMEKNMLSGSVKMTDCPQSFQHALYQPENPPNEAGPVVQDPNSDKLEGQLTEKLVERAEGVQETRVSPPKQKYGTAS